MLDSTSSVWRKVWKTSENLKIQFLSNVLNHTVSQVGGHVAATADLFSKKILTSKNGLQTPFLALEGLKLRKSGILRGHNPNFLAKRERSIASPVWEKRGHNHPKSLYRTDFWISASFDFECALNARYAQKLLWRLYKRHVKMASKIPEHEFFWFSQNRF